jgi:signal transduction histidine kinase
MSRPSRRLLLCFVAIFAPLSAVTSAIVLALYWSQDAALGESRRTAERNVVARQQQIIAGELRAVVADAMIMSRLSALGELVGDPSPPRRQTLAAEYRLFLDERRIYDQARLLDPRGMEIVRVNYLDGRAQIVSAEKLQDKGDRYYFQAAAKLAPGQLYVSPFDLNVEDGGIEQPAKPTIRFAAPVYAGDAALAGVVILNYLGQNLLDKLRAASAGALGDVSLVNGDGYWLLGPSPEREWGFMYPDRRLASLAHHHADAWQAIVAASSGQFEAEDGLWTHQLVRPLSSLPTGDAIATSAAADSANSAAATSAATEYAWRIVSHVPVDVIARETTQLRQGFWRLYASLLLVLAIVSWLWARVAMAHRAAREQLLQSERLSAIGEAMAALTHESRNALQRSQAGLDMLAKRVADRPEAVQLLGEVQQAQYFLRDQYEAVRDYAAPMRLHCEAVDIRDAVRDAWNELADQRKDRGVVLVEHAAEVDTTVWADRRAAGQVARNLLANALEADASVSRIEITYADDRLDGGAALKVAVRDDGPGMSAEQRQRVFEPFFTTKPRGTGLGMAICRRIAEAHGGDIFVADNNRRGTEIVVILPKPKP